MDILVTSHNRVSKDSKKWGATHILSTIDPGKRPPYLRVPKENHFIQYFEDDESITAFYCPKKEHIQAILDWTAKLPNHSKLLIHCHAGVCRSTAVALAVWLQHNGDYIWEAGEWLFKIRPQALPNRLIARYADEILNLNGRLLQLAVEIGDEYMIKYLGAKERERPDWYASYIKENPLSYDSQKTA